MKHRRLGRTGLMVPPISLGTFTFGGRGSFGAVGTQGPDEARRLVDLALERGATLIDTANMYSLGLSEEIVGEVLEGRRDDTLICTKARMPIGDGPNDEGASRWHLIRECERSLKRLRTDRIDIYLVHEWDGLTPPEETAAAMERLIAEGKIRHWGISNYSGWQASKAIYAAEAAGLERPACQQIHYTLEAREAEYELLPLSVDAGLGVMVWSPLAAGLLTGKHGPDGFGAGSRQDKGWTEQPVRDPDRLWRIVDALKEVASARGASPAQVALAWLLGRPAISTLVVGARDETQLAETLDAADMTLTEEERGRLDAVSRPPLLYPHWHQHQFCAPRFTEADRALHDGQEVDGMDWYEGR